MSYPDKGYGTYGPLPWQQTSWDWRAAGNFIGGGTGSGLIVFTAVSGVGGIARSALLLAGLAFVGLGLVCVALELGRPLRALRVFRNPRTSWMAREAWTSALLFPVGLAVAAGIPGFVWFAAALALVFLYCQARLLQAAKGIPAWREPLLRPLLVMTGLTEGAGVFLFVAPFHGIVAFPVLLAFGVLLLARFVVWLAYRRRLDGVAAPGALAALDAAGRLLVFAGTAVPLVLVGGRRIRRRACDHAGRGGRSARRARRCILQTGPGHAGGIQPGIRARARAGSGRAALAAAARRWR